jgi:hypothetical protein
MKNLIDERSFPVIDVGNNGNVTNGWHKSGREDSSRWAVGNGRREV